MAGLFILKHTHNLSDEALCERWLENPDFQYVCAEVMFQHGVPFDRSSLTRWRQRLGEEQNRGALAGEPFDGTPGRGYREQGPRARGGGYHLPGESNCAPDRRAPTHAAQARRHHGGSYTHAHQFKRAQRELKFLQIRLGRIIRDIRRKIEGDPALGDRFGSLLELALQVRPQEQRRRGSKVRSLRVPEVEYIGRGRARAPHQFGCRYRSLRQPPRPKEGSSCCKAPAPQPLRRPAWSRHR